MAERKQDNSRHTKMRSPSSNKYLTRHRSMPFPRLLLFCILCSDFLDLVNPLVPRHLHSIVKGNVPQLLLIQNQASEDTLCFSARSWFILPLGQSSSNQANGSPFAIAKWSKSKVSLETRKMNEDLKWIQPDPVLFYVHLQIFQSHNVWTCSGWPETSRKEGEE